MKDNKSIYEKPLLKVVEVELNECIANSFKVKDSGSNLHEALNGEYVDKEFVSSSQVDWDPNW